MNKSNLGIAIYCRLACKDRHRMKQQKTELVEFAKSLGYDNFTLYIDNGYSGATLDRSAFSNLNKAIQGGKVKTVIMRDISRIGRNYLLVPKWIEEAKQQGVTLLAMDGSLQS